MKKLITTSLFILCLMFAWGQAPQKMTYQAVVRDGGNTLIANSAVGMQISILQGSPTGTAVYVETQNPTTNINGLATLQVGAGAVVSGTFSTIDWSTGSYYIKSEVDPTGGTTYTITGTAELISVPYALYAESGNQGPAGPTGPAGADGVDGATGAAGATGPAGATGATGTIGATGTQGPQGIQGPPGTNGVDGIDGVDGLGTAQTLSQAGSVVTLSDGGGSINIDDADADPTNEIQTLSQSGSLVALSNGGGSISINDADADPANEIQTLSLSGSDLTISGSNTVTLPGGGGANTLDQAYDQGGAGVGSDISADAGPVTINGTGAVTANNGRLHVTSVGGSIATPSAAIYGLNQTFGSVGFGLVGEISNSDNPGAAVAATSNGTGQAFAATMTGTGSAGLFQVTNASSAFAAVAGSTNGSGSTFH